MARTKVLTVIRHPVGGIRTVLKYTYGSMDRSKYEFTLCMPESDEGELLRQDLNGFEVTLVQVPDRQIGLRLVIKVAQLIAKGRCDLIHSHGFTSGFLTAIANIGSRKPHILTLHDVLRKEYFASPLGPIKKGLPNYCIRRSM